MSEFLSTKQAKSKPIEDLTSILSTNVEQGLSKDEVEKRQSIYGYNELVEKHVNPFIKLLKNFWGPIPLMIEAAIVLSVIDRNWNDVIIIGALLLINALIEFFQSHKADNAIAELKKSFASKAKVKRNGSWTEVEAWELVPGDIIWLRLGDIIPADVKLFKGDYLMIDESALTGESLPVDKHAGDVGYSGSVVKQGEMNALVYGTGSNTFFGKTAKLVEGAKTKSHFQTAVIRIGNYLIMLNLILVMIVVITGLIREESIWNVLQFALVLTVAAIPAALPAVLSVTMAVGALKLSKKKAIISKLVAIEEIAGMDVLCSDKTGTITQNKLSITGLHPFGDFVEKDVISIAALSAEPGDKDPIDDAIIDQLFEDAKLKEDFNNSKQLKSIPFDPVSKKTEAEIERGGQKFKVSKGAPQIILSLCHNRDDNFEQVEKIILKEGSHGFRTLGVAKTNGEDKWHFVGLISLSDPPREDSAETIIKAQEMGIDVKMITGDHQVIACEIAKQVHIKENILPAKEFVNLPDRSAKRLIEEADGISEVYPEHKYEIVELLQMNNHIVGMTGDGVNDAPALKKADAGIAVDGATDAAKSAADIVLTRPGLSVIIDAIEESRKIFQRMQSYAIYRISETIDVLFFTVLAILIFNQYPVTAIMIVLLAVFNDFPIMAISYDKVKYSMKPEVWHMNKVISIASVLGLSNVVFTFFIYIIGRDILLMNTLELQTLVFAELSIAGNLTIFLSRNRGPLWSKRPGSALVWSTVISKGIITLIVAFGWFMAPIGWWVLGVWVYAMIQMLITDRVKLLAYKVLEHHYA